jgi:chromosomal replication initiator protein
MQDVTKNDTEIVSALRAAVAARLGPRRFDFWFAGGDCLTLANGVVRVCLPSSFCQDWVRTNFRRDLEACCEQVLGAAPPIEFFVVDAAAADSSGGSPPAHDVKPSIAMPQDGRETVVDAVSESSAYGATRRKFASLAAYVVGDGNRIAHSSAEIAARRIGELNPLYLHGPTGVGKTHLLEGIWSAVRQTHRQAHALYLSAEQFTTGFVQAVHGGGLPSFRRKYRHVDLLLIDDVQFFRGKLRTVEELLHTLDAMLKADRQIVLAGDAAPSDLSELGPELVTRLQGGMVCRIARPDYETRLGIVRGLAAAARFPTPQAVLEYVARHLAAGARELTGAMNRLQATSEALSQPITLALAEDALADLVHHSQRLIRLSDIERAVCQEFGLSPESLQSNGKGKTVSHPRMLAMWLARKHTRAGLAEIGAYFGRRSHSTVVSAQQRITGWLAARTAVEVSDRRCPIDEAVRRVEERLRMA